MLLLIWWNEYVGSDAFSHAEMETGGSKPFKWHDTGMLYGLFVYGTV